MPRVKNLLEIHEDVPAYHYDEGIKNNLFQRIWHARRFSQILEVVKPVSGAILDVGCHSGTFTQKLLAKVGTKKVYGVDISPGAIAAIKKRIPFGEFKVADGINLPYEDNFFEAVFCLEMLEHVDNPIKVLSEIHRVLKKGGYAIILVPTDNRMFKFIWFLWTLYYPVWRHAHVQSFKNNELEKILEKLNFKKINSQTFNLGMLKRVVCYK